jgi:hypothetical protein
MLTKEQKFGCCPNCNSDWDEGLVFDVLSKNNPDKTVEEIEEQSKHYGGNDQHFSKLIGVSSMEKYDGILYFLCPECKVKIHRFDSGDFRFDLAKELGAKSFDEVLNDAPLIDDLLKTKLSEFYNYRNEYYEFILPVWTIMPLQYKTSMYLETLQRNALNEFKKHIPEGGKWDFSDQSYGPTNSYLFPLDKKQRVIDVRYHIKKEMKK